MTISVVIFLNLILIVVSSGRYCHIPNYGQGHCVPSNKCYLKNKIGLNKSTFCKTNGYHSQPLICCPIPKNVENLDDNDMYAESNSFMFPDLYQSELPISAKKCYEYQFCKNCIIDGERTNLGEFPHMAALGFGNENDIMWLCGGSLISENFVLTVAHCLSQRDLYVQHVRLGQLNMKSDPNEMGVQTYTVVKRFKHPKYSPMYKYNDIGLLELNQNVKFTHFVQPACLQTTYAIPNDNMIAIGWGKTKYLGEISDELLKVDLSPFPGSLCRKIFRKRPQRNLPYGIVDNMQLCAGSFNDTKDTCEGDSGGPLQMINQFNNRQYVIIGITSFGVACGIVNIPSVYTRVSHYVPWIEKIVWPNEYEENDF